MKLLCPSSQPSSFRLPPTSRHMEPSESRPSPRRELQGPRPAPLKVSKVSHKIKKPPVAPLPHHHQYPPAAPAPPRHPVIIYTVSPKIIHTKPSEFMTLVQRLTGPNSVAPDDDAEPSSLPSPAPALSPAARIATFEKSTAPPPRAGEASGATTMDHQWEFEHRPAPFPGILSPVPASLPPISPNLFSPSTFDPSLLSFLHEMSPVFANNTNMATTATATAATATTFNNNFLTSPNPINYNLLSTPTVPSPGAFWEFLNQFPDM
ncbi:protein MKS1-like [Canna indica]|uniref:Protein MKS1-like n=1 Tax=Canna indica TaxID=4628 RepID=A0AAQ3JXX4_9LILI|nr:protein MKS1-like [Canna indica]